jgi:hypothetical protein
MYRNRNKGKTKTRAGEYEQGLGEYWGACHHLFLLLHIFFINNT